MSPWAAGDRIIHYHRGGEESCRAARSDLQAPPGQPRKQQIRAYSFDGSRDTPSLVDNFATHFCVYVKICGKVSGYFGNSPMSTSSSHTTTFVPNVCDHQSLHFVTLFYVMRYHHDPTQANPIQTYPVLAIAILSLLNATGTPLVATGAPFVETDNPLV